MRFLFCLLTALLTLPAQAQGSPFGGYEGEDYEDPEVRTELPSQAFGKAPVRLVYDHVTQATTLLDARGETVETWQRADGRPYAEVPSDRPVVVEVQNANALVYSYDVQAVVARALPSAPSCGGQARQFLLAGGLLAGQSLSPETQVDMGSGSSFADFLGVDFSGVSGLAGRRGAEFSESELQSVADEAQSAVVSMRSAAQQLSQAQVRAQQSVLDAARRGDSQPIDPLLAAIQAQLNSVAAGMSDPARVPTAISALVPDVAQQLNALAATAAAVREGGLDEDGFENAEGYSDAEAAVLALAQIAERSAAQISEASGEIQRLALRVEKARYETTQRTTIRPNDDLRQVAIDIREADDPVEGVVATRQRTIEAYLAPRPARGFGCAVAVALTFSPRAPEYGFLDGELVDDADEGLSSAPAVLFEVAPPVIGQALGLVGGIGLGRNFAPDLYAGASIRLLRPVLITGGAVWRRAETLPSGFSLGDELDPDGDITEFAFLENLDKQWTPSFFLGLSIAP